MTKSSTGLIIALVAIIVGTGLPLIGAFSHILYGWFFIVEACFLFLHTLTALISSTMVKKAGPKGILFVTALVAFIAGLVAISLGSLDVQIALAPFLTISNLDLMLTTGMAVITIVAFLWLLRPFTVSQRVNLAVVFGIAAICTIIQSPLANNSTEKHIFLLVAIIALILGTGVAIQSERSK